MGRCILTMLMMIIVMKAQTSIKQHLLVRHHMTDLIKRKWDLMETSWWQNRMNPTEQRGSKEELSTNSSKKPTK